MSKVIEMKQLRSPEDRMVLIPNIDVFRNMILTSAHNIKSDLITNQVLSEKQVVVAVGPNAAVEVGDWVKINVNTFPKTSKPGGHDVGTVVTIQPPFEKIENTEYLYMGDNSIMYRIHKKE